jgi:hypothetical protein
MKEIKGKKQATSKIKIKHSHKKNKTHTKKETKKNAGKLHLRINLLHPPPLCYFLLLLPYKPKTKKKILK